MNYELKIATKEDESILIEYKLKSIFDYAVNLDEKEINRINNFVKENIPLQIDNYKMIFVGESKCGALLVTNEKDGVLLDEIYLEENFRNKGIGTDIIKNLIKEKKKVYLWVYKNNINAISLYKNLGFEIKEETETRYYMESLTSREYF